MASDSDFSWPWDWWNCKFYLLIFPCMCRSPKWGWTCTVCQFEGKVARDSELDSKLDSVTPNWIGSAPCCVCSLGSPAPSWGPTCPPWSTPWFLITIKSLGSNLSSRSLADEHKNEFTWWFSGCAHDLIFGPCTSMEGVVVSDIVMSSLKPEVLVFQTAGSSFASKTRCFCLPNQTVRFWHIEDMILSSLNCCEPLVICITYYLFTHTFCCTPRMHRYRGGCLGFPWKNMQNGGI
jgi:hypothetical protein